MATRMIAVKTMCCAVMVCHAVPHLLRGQSASPARAGQPNTPGVQSAASLQAPAHAALLQTAKATELHPPVDDWTLIGRVYDYPRLVKQDTTLAAVFTTHHFLPERYEATQVAVHWAMMVLVEDELHAMSPRPDSASPVIKNIGIVRAQRRALEAVGVVPYGNEGTLLSDGSSTGGTLTPDGIIWLKMMEP